MRKAVAIQDGIVAGLLVMMVVLAAPRLALAQYDPNSGQDPSQPTGGFNLQQSGDAIADNASNANGDDDAQAASRAQSTTWLQWRRMLARQRSNVLWGRFSPFARGVAGNGVLPDGLRAAQVVGMSVAPVAGTVEQLGWSLWLQSSSTHLRNTSSTLRGKGYTLQETFGLDRQLGESTTLGLSYSPSYSSARTRYNNGRERTWNHMGGLYLSHRFTPWLSLDVQGGYVYQRQKLRRQDTLGVYTGRRTSNGYHLSGALNASAWLNQQVMLSGRLGIIATRDKWRGYTENGPLGATSIPGLKQTLVQGVAEVGLAWWADPLMPYVKAAYNHDLYRKGLTGSSNRRDVMLTGGFLWYGDAMAKGLSLDVSGSAVLGRSHQQHFLFNLGMRWAW